MSQPTITCPRCGSDQIKFAELVLRQTDAPITRWMLLDPDGRADAQGRPEPADYGSFDTIEEETVPHSFWCCGCESDVDRLELLVNGQAQAPLNADERAEWIGTRAYAADKILPGVCKTTAALIGSMAENHSGDFIVGRDNIHLLELRQLLFGDPDFAFAVQQQVEAKVAERLTNDAADGALLAAATTTREVQGAAGVNLVAAIRCVKAVLLAYARGFERGGSMDWDEVGVAFEHALRALPGLYATLAPDDDSYEDTDEQPLADEHTLWADTTPIHPAELIDAAREGAILERFTGVATDAVAVSDSAEGTEVIPAGRHIPTARAEGFPKLVATDLEAMDEVTFRSHLILEGSWGSRPIGAEDGSTESTMILYRNPQSAHPYMIEWDVPDLEITENIGLTFDNDRNLIDYDGICGYPPIEAIELLERNGYHVGPDFRDEDEDDAAGHDVEAFERPATRGASDPDREDFHAD